jgi:CheY-like chemotaxis protein
LEPVARKHAQKREAIGRLAGGVAHDFNNLLQVVAGNCELLQGGTFGSADACRMLQEIHQQAERGTQLVRRLLVFSRRESYAPRGMDLGDVLRGAETLVRRLLKENIELIVELAEGPLPVLGDGGQLEQVLMNLVVNASDVMSDGGSLEIRSGEEAGEVWFSLADTGPGISGEMLNRVFDPYLTTKSEAQGTGLGLAVVDGIVSVHGGRIEVDNRLGSGVEFKIFLPREEADTATPEPTTEGGLPSRSRGDRVLVVEDQELVRGTMQSMLTSLGYEVMSAADGAVARRCAADQEFDLLVSDIVLPDTTGVELAQDFRAARPGLAVLLVSGYAEEAVRERGAEFRFLQRPFRLEDLAQQAADALRDEKAEGRR